MLKWLRRKPIQICILQQSWHARCSLSRVPAMQSALAVSATCWPAAHGWKTILAGRPYGAISRGCSKLVETCGHGLFRPSGGFAPNAGLKSRLARGASDVSCLAVDLPLTAWQPPGRSGGVRGPRFFYQLLRPAGVPPPAPPLCAASRHPAGLRGMSRPAGPASVKSADRSTKAAARDTKPAALTVKSAAPRYIWFDVSLRFWPVGSNGVEPPTLTKSP